MMPTARSLRGPLAIAAVAVAVDQLTKHWALNTLEGGRTIDLIGSLRLNLAFNRGMAFSQGAGLGPVIGVVALLVMVALLVSVGRSTSRIYPLAVGLILGGAAGNLIDRLFRDPGWLRGAVVDFIDLQWWPVFNVADIGITVGGVLLLLSSLRRPDDRPAPTPAPDSAPESAADSATNSVDAPER